MSLSLSVFENAWEGKPWPIFDLIDFDCCLLWCRQLSCDPSWFPRLYFPEWLNLSPFIRVRHCGFLWLLRRWSNGQYFSPPTRLIRFWWVVNCISLDHVLVTLFATRQCHFVPCCCRRRGRNFAFVVRVHCTGFNTRWNHCHAIYRYGIGDTSFLDRYCVSGRWYDPVRTCCVWSLFRTYCIRSSLRFRQMSNMDLVDTNRLDWYIRHCRKPCWTSWTIVLWLRNYICLSTVAFSPMPMCSVRRMSLALVDWKAPNSVYLSLWINMFVSISHLCFRELLLRRRRIVHRYVVWIPCRILLLNRRFKTN